MLLSIIRSETKPKLIITITELHCKRYQPIPMSIESSSFHIPSHDCPLQTSWISPFGRKTRSEPLTRISSSMHHHSLDPSGRKRVRERERPSVTLYPHGAHALPDENAASTTASVLETRTSLVQLQLHRCPLRRRRRLRPVQLIVEFRSYRFWFSAPRGKRVGNSWENKRKRKITLTNSGSVV